MVKKENVRDVPGADHGRMIGAQIVALRLLRTRRLAHAPGLHPHHHQRRRAVSFIVKHDIHVHRVNWLRLSLETLTSSPSCKYFWATMSADPHADLRRQFHDLQRTYDSMLLWEPTRPKPPIIDSSVENDASHKESLPGQRAFLEAIERDLDVMEKVSIRCDSPYYC